MRALRWPWLLLLAWLACAGLARAAAPEGEITLQARWWLDAGGRAGVADAEAAPLQPYTQHRAFHLGDAALWMRFEVPALAGPQRWYLLLSGAPFINRASLYLPDGAGGWRAQHAGDRLPVAQWPNRNPSPLFSLPAGGATVAWLRLENQPAPTSPIVQLVAEPTLQARQAWTYLLVGGYLGFGLLVMVVGAMHARLYNDRVFHLYCAYVGFMLLFQLAFTGLGGLFLWPNAPAFNDAAPPLFVLLMTGAGIAFNREATALRRHSRHLARAVLLFAAAAPLLAAGYVAVNNAFAYAVLNAYALAAVLVSIAMCAWTWRQGEKYSGWLLLGFAPVHLGYPFPALRAAGVLPDSWATEYAVLIGSAIEIPLLLYILHWRAKDFSENHARLRALDSTDPLTGLAGEPVLRLRLRDALRRAHRAGNRCALLMVELANHAEIATREGREAADRALVVAGSRLSQLVREVDTVCRVADARFAILVDGPQRENVRRDLAQHIVARGLEPVPQLPADVLLRFRVVSAAAPQGAIVLTEDNARDEQRLVAQLHAELDAVLKEPRRVIVHLEGPVSGAK